MASFLSHPIAWLLFILCCGCAEAESETVNKIRLQDDGKASDESMLDAGIVTLPEITQITICFHIFLLHSSAYNPVISYYAEYDNELSVGIFWDSQTMDFTCCQLRVTLLMKVAMDLRTWHHVCIASDLATRKYWLAYDDHFEEGSLPVIGSDMLRVDKEGRFVIGQELDSIAGGFNFRQSTHGDIAHLKIFTKVLDPYYLKAYCQCQDLVIDSEPLYSFSGNFSDFLFRGSVAKSEVPLKDLCLKKPRLFMLPEKRIFRIAQDACTRMKSSMTIPRSEEENKEIFDDVSQFNEYCVDAYGSLYWMGGKGNTETGKWLRLDNKEEIKWSKFDTGYDKVTPTKQCLTGGGLSFPYFWYATDCNFLTCPLCNFTDVPYFTIRGLCKDTLVDQSLSLYDYVNFKPQFLGPFYTSIYWNNASLTWMMRSRAEENLLGVMEMRFHDDYPIGVKTWNITGDKCTSNVVELLITSCNATEYTCDDGMCIAKDQRCDMTLDCPDKSDEANCNIIMIPFGYSTQLPPPRPGDEPLPVLFYMGITSVREIDILGFKMALDVVLELRWKDRRLQMKNLRANTRANKVQNPEAVWQPIMQIEDGSSSLADAMLRSRSLMVEKEADHIPDNTVKIHEDDIYLGSENIMYLREVDTIGFTCQFQLQRYPFDKQMCSLTFTLVDVSSDFVILTKDKIGSEFLGQKTLLEYEVTMVNMTFVNDSTSVGQKVAIELRNLYGYYISGTYIPTTLLVIICYLTLFFDLDDFTDRVMVSLTSLLVLSSLFTQTSQSIPKTAYLKLIDVWFVVVIVFVFIIVLILVIIENMRLKISSSRNKVFVATGQKWNQDTKNFSENISPTFSNVKNDFHNDPLFINFLAKIVILFCFVIFIISYAAVSYSGL